MSTAASEKIPAATTYLVIGAGVNGLSTAWHLAMELKARGKGSGADVLVIDKTGPGGGAVGHRLRAVARLLHEPCRCIR